MKKNSKNNNQEYKFIYLYRYAGKGSKKIFCSKDSWDFYLAIIISSILTTLLFINTQTALKIPNFLIVATTSASALLGLIIASYAILSSMSDKKFLLLLVESGNYQYAIFQFTWSGIFLFVSIIFGLISISFGIYSLVESIVLQIIIMAIFDFLFIYGVFGAFVSFFTALRQLAIMNTRKDQDFLEAWNRYLKNQGKK